MTDPSLLPLGQSRTPLHRLVERAAVSAAAALGTGALVALIAFAVSSQCDADAERMAAMDGSYPTTVVSAMIARHGRRMP